MPASIFDDPNNQQPVRSKLSRGFLIMGLLPATCLFLSVLWQANGAVSASLWWALLVVVAGTVVLACWLGRRVGEPLDNLHGEMRSLLINITRLVQSTASASLNLRQQLTEAAVRREKAKNMSVTCHWN